MLKKIRNSLISIAIGLAIIFVLLGNYYPQRGVVFAPGIERPDGFGEYEREVQKRKRINENKLGHTMSSYQFGAVGFAQVTFDTTYPQNIVPDKREVFLTLHNLYIKENSKLDIAEYLMENEKPYIIKGNLKEALPFYLELKPNESRASDDINTKVMLPINKSTQYILKGLSFVSLAIGAFLIIGIFLGGIVKLIEEISKGKAFTEYTIIILRNISYASFAVPIFYLIESSAVWFYMYLKYPGGFGLDPAVYFSSARLMFVGIFFYALYRAFKKGYKLQQENDLTV